MSKRRTPYWGAVKAIIRRYNGIDGGKAKDLTETEKSAVRTAIEATGALLNGPDRLRLIDLVFWQRSHSLTGAAAELYLSNSTAIRWHTAFIWLVLRELHLED